MKANETSSIIATLRKEILSGKYLFVPSESVRDAEHGDTER